MSKNKWYMALLIALILMVIFYVSNGMLSSGKREEYHSISVILEDSGNDRWNAFKEGLDQGVEGRKVYLNVVSTGEFLNLEEECSFISRELENGADGLIVDLCADDVNSIFEGMASSKPVVLVENGIQSEKLYTTVTPDQYRLGEAIGEAVLAAEKGTKEQSTAEGESGARTEEAEDFADISVGILAGNQEKLSQRQRLEGLLASLSAGGVTADWTLTREDKGSLAYYYLKNPVDVLITLDNDETEWAVDYLLERGGKGFRIYGEGRSEKAVYYLDKGMIRALIVPNEFYMGYQSVELLAQKIKFFTSPVENEEVDFLTVTGENLYDKAVEKILFPVMR